MKQRNPRLFSSAVADEIEFLAARARALGSARANAMLAPLGLRVRQYAVLALAASGFEPSQRELAQFLSLDASQIVSIVDQLEQRALLIRQPDSRDRRSNAIVATAIGRELAGRAGAAVKIAEDRSLALLSTEQRETLRELLQIIAFDEA
jgi:DNA-binding MarR family transcriptional regulator